MSNEHQRMIFRENRIRLQLKEELETELGIQERKIEEQKTESRLIQELEEELSILKENKDQVQLSIEQELEELFQKIYSRYR
jgi:hypothetical protein